MTFLWVNKRDWRHPGPIVNVGVRNAASLAARGGETHLVLGAGAASDTAADLREFYGVGAPAGLHVHRVARRRLLFGVAGVESSVPIFRHAVGLARRLARRGPVAVLTREASFLPYLAALRRWVPGVRAFYEAHDLYADLSWRAAEGRPVRWGDRRQGFLERLCLPWLDGLVCITEPQRVLYAGLFPRLPAVALPLGTDPQPPGDEEARRRGRRLVYVGHLNRQKGIESLFRAAPALAGAGVRLALWGGYGQQAEALRGRAVAEGWGEMVEGAGFRPPEELRRDLATRAGVGLVTLEETFYNRHLTCPVKALDYLSHGLPVVASDLPTTRGVLGDGGAARYVPPGDAGALAAAVRAFFDDAELYARASAAARARAAELSWDNRAARLEAFVATAGGGEEGVRS